MDRDSLPRALTLQHEAFKKVLEGRLLSASAVRPVGRVLDIGTGCGIVKLLSDLFLSSLGGILGVLTETDAQWMLPWAAEFAVEHPAADILGIDIFPQPTIAAPRNCSFVTMDAEQDWEMGDAKFDIIHARLVPFHAKEMPTLLRRCFEHLNPGGHVEMQYSWPPCRTDEPSGAPEHASRVIEWSKLRLEAASKIGVDHNLPGQLPEALSEAGFVMVKTHDYKWPIGPWMEDEKMKDIGNTVLELLQLGMEDPSTSGLSHLGMEERQITLFAKQVGKELGVGKIYIPVRIAWAMKPMTGP